MLVKFNKHRYIIKYGRRYNFFYIFYKCTIPTAFTDKNIYYLINF